LRARRFGFERFLSSIAPRRDAIERSAVLLPGNRFESASKRAPPRPRGDARRSIGVDRAGSGCSCSLMRIISFTRMSMPRMWYHTGQSSLSIQSVPPSRRRPGCKDERCSCRRWGHRGRGDRCSCSCRWRRRSQPAPRHGRQPVSCFCQRPLVLAIATS